jgi:hypothetical protein
MALPRLINGPSPCSMKETDLFTRGTIARLTLPDANSGFLDRAYRLVGAPLSYSKFLFGRPGSLSPKTS